MIEELDERLKNLGWEAVPQEKGTHKTVWMKDYYGTGITRHIILAPGVVQFERWRDGKETGKVAVTQQDILALAEYIRGARAIVNGIFGKDERENVRAPE